MAIVEARNLGKKYEMGETLVTALDGVNVAVAEGEFVAVMGPSGSGKSTLLHLLGGLDVPTEGEVLLAGRRLSAMKDQEATIVRRRQVGFVFQFFNLLPTLTAEENVALPLRIDGRNVEDYRGRIDDLFELVGLADRREHRPDQLSGGEQQRVAVARALVTGPAIVLADEPTGNLDSQAGDDVLCLLRRACDERGQTIVMASHDAQAAGHADRVLFLRDGRVDGEAKLTPGSDSGAILEHLAKGGG